MRHLLALALAAIVFLGLAALVARSGNQDLLLVLLSLAVAAPVVYLVRDRFVQQNRLLELKEQALRAELALLKNQINPHFFFNTLNNLYGLAVAKSDQAPVMILKLADLLRFTIYEGRKDQVPLAAEIAYLESYLDLQRIRARPGLLELSFVASVDDDNAEIAPLLLIVLVENAFKHGVARATGPAFVHLRLSSRLARLELEVDNNVGAAADGAAAPGGLGLANLRRRLELLYPEKHGLTTTRVGDTFQARLWLML